MSRSRGGRRRLAVVDRRLAAIRQADHHEAAAADVARARVRHRQREADGDRGVHGVAALLQDVHAGLATRNASADATIPCRARDGLARGAVDGAEPPHIAAMHAMHDHARGARRRAGVTAAADLIIEDVDWASPTAGRTVSLVRGRAAGPPREIPV